MVANLVVFVLVCLGVVNSQRSALPSPIVDVTKITRSPAPYSSMCCVLSKFIGNHFYFQRITKYNDRIEYDVDYFCDHLAYTVTQLVHVQNVVHDCRAVAALVTKMVAKKMLEIRSQTSVSVFNKIVLASFRSYSEYLVDGSNPNSVLSILSRTLVSRGFVAKDVDYIKRRVAYTINNVYTTRVVSFLERLELSQTLLELQTLNTKVMTIINGTGHVADFVASKIKAAVKTTLHNDAANAFGPYKLRAYYIAFFKATLSSAQASKAINDIQFVLSNVHTQNGAFSAGQISTIISSVNAALNGLQNWIGGMLQGILGRDLKLIDRTIASSGGHSATSGFNSGISFSSAEVATLVNSLGWINLRIISKPKDLLTEYKDLLSELTKYKLQMESFAVSLSNRPMSERRFHESSIAFVQSLISAIQGELKDSTWVHTYSHGSHGVGTGTGSVQGH